MATRYIKSSYKKSGCTRESEIIGVCGDFGSQRYLRKQDVHDHIKSKSHTYYSRASGENDALVLAKGSGVDRYIQTEADDSAKNNLVNLPDCSP